MNGNTQKFPELFKECVFSFVGEISNKTELQQAIESRQGTVQNSVTKKVLFLPLSPSSIDLCFISFWAEYLIGWKVTHVISTFDEVSKTKPSTKIANAIKWEIPIVSSGVCVCVYVYVYVCYSLSHSFHLI
jgi:hypothetical protein